MLTDIQIANSVKPKKIVHIADSIGIHEDCVDFYGGYKAKINYKDLKPKGKLILVTAINPTPAGEGKTTVTIGLTDALKHIGKSVAAAIREPSLGPVFGVKGGAAGGGYAQVIPMEAINLHFTGDIHAITAANNLLSALIDNSIHQGNTLKIHPKKVMWKRCVDLNDRALREVTVGHGKEGNGRLRDENFYITAASEVMAILCLASDMQDLKKRLGNILVAYTYEGKPIFARDLKAENAMAILLKEAIKPNLVQTLEGTPAFVHGGPFANIAHGCNSIIATKMALSFADYVVTEAGFGADLGAEKFLDVKCRIGGIAPSCVVIVATVRALKMHGGVAKTDLAKPNVEALKKGLVNLEKHIENITKNFGLSAVVAINRFASDTTEEMDAIKAVCQKLGVKAVAAEGHGKGGAGGVDLANEVVAIADKVKTPKIKFLYELNESIEAKIEKICKKNYGAAKVVFEHEAVQDMAKIAELGYGDLPIIMAKTQYSFSDNPTLLGRPEGFNITVRRVQLRAGSGFLVAVAGDIMLMPGLPKVPASDNMILNDDGSIEGLF